MMRIDDLPNLLETFLDRARGVLAQDIEKTNRTLMKLNAQKITAQTALAELENSRGLAQTQLAAVRFDLQRGSELVSLNHEIAEARKTLGELKADIAREHAARDGAVKQRGEAEKELNSVLGEIERLRQERIEAHADMKHITQLLGSVELRRSA
jgi:chromosome segregation ATPase